MKYFAFVLVIVVLASATVANGEQIFYSTFDNMPAGALLTGQTADSGQIWADSPKTEVNDYRGKGSLDLDTNYGQSSTMGAGAKQEGNYWQGNSVALGQTISEGILTLTFDLKRHRTSSHNGSTELNVALDGSTEMALIWNGGSLKVGGSVTGYDGGAWQKSLDMGISTGDVAVELVLDMDAQTGTLSYDQYGSTNSGSVALDAITSADISFDSLMMTLRTIDETLGYDNIMVDNTVVPEPSTVGMLLLACAGFFVFPLRRNR